MKYREMRFFVFLALFGWCFAQYDDYIWEEDDFFFNIMDENPFVRLLDLEDGWPRRIEYLQTITPESGLMIRVTFSDDNGPLDTDDIILNICDALTNAISDPESDQARYQMAAPLGMRGSTCPIEPGVKRIGSGRFPFNLTEQDLGCDVKYFQMRIENENGTVEDEPIMDFRINLHRFNSNETCTFSSSNNLSSPSIAIYIIAALFAVTFTSYSVDLLPGRKYRQ